ncbi:hypothetical protein [Haploplasma modicum]|uniref:hypothetical protein n=1 Tax=Haploplasma modicum TaxID=2150 RepID=UPI00047D3B59|nr:hypothetical protein [Haploplasma modicum]
MNKERKLYINSGYALATYIGLNIGLAFIGIHFNFPGRVNIYFLFIYTLVVIFLILSIIRFYKNRSNIEVIKGISKIESTLIIINQVFLFIINYFCSELIIADNEIQKIKGMNLFYFTPMIIILIYIRINSIRFKVNKMF